MPHLGVPELLIILVIVLAVFGASRLPAIGQGLGQSIGGFRRALKDEGEEPTSSAAGLNGEGSS